MREIKFRFWNKGENRMIYSGDDKWELFWSQTCGFSFNIISNGAGDWGVDNNLVNQFTGLKDKNGKEIYEGDIIRNESGTGFVEYDLETATWLFGKHRYSKGYSFEVIGNIYENPDLIKN